ncbi:membrane protein [Carbonactinospora thermoautotrophica]|uniref:Membrane protein n=1 Tax=Carbonactinospora thermoautotrophica TaxID=1469144 RepID=A0A132NAV5_9ACTN|nr:membrane protein [Carbonactinospora thermoautotrophica]KWX07301.1 membrane protein [Carbonactinospora thermoautotrophica]
MQETSTNRRRAVRPKLVVAGLCLLVPIVTSLWVSSYARVEPRLFGFPFFYWYQLLLIPISVTLTAIAYVLVVGEERARKRARQRSDDAEEGTQ